MNVVIIKYNAGNIRSVSFALERLGINATVSDDPQVIKAADKVIFPGVGEASSAMQYLKEKGLDDVIKSLNSPRWVFVWECSCFVLIRRKTMSIVLD